MKSLYDPHYYKGKKCKKCGNTYRYFSNNQCVSCNHKNSTNRKINEDKKQIGESALIARKNVREYLDNKRENQLLESNIKEVWE